MIKYYLIYYKSVDEDDIHTEFDSEEELISFLDYKGCDITPVSLVRGEQLTISPKKISYSIGKFKEVE